MSDKLCWKSLQLFKMVGISLIVGGAGPSKVQNIFNAQLNVASDSSFSQQAQCCNI